MKFPAADSLARIREQLARMRAFVQSPAALTTVESVSGWSPAEHIDHTIKVAASIVNRLTKPEPVDSSISILGRAVLLFGWIPRGRGRSPARLHGARETPIVLEAALSKFEDRLGSLSLTDVDGPQTPVVPHPRFGGLTPQQALRFLAIHTEHHLKIVDEIVRAGSR